MSEDEKKQEKMEVLYLIAELEAEMGCIRSRLSGAQTFATLAERLPSTSPESGATPATPLPSR